MPRHPRSRRHRGPPPPPRAPRPTATPEPASPVRSLIQAAIVTAAALDAHDDLAAAAASLQRLGRLTSGMWRALGQELATAAERLDRQARDRLDDLHRQAQVLRVDPHGALAAGVAAGHLEEHRATLDTVVSTLAEDVRRLAVSEILLGFTIDASIRPDDDEPEEEDASAAAEAAVWIWLFLWPAPLTPAGVAITPMVTDTQSAAPERAVSMEVDVEMAAPLVDVLALASGVPTERLPSALSALALACWTAHQVDERDEDEDNDEAEDDADD